jgi:ribosomal protein S18 acetylase RimI-like enzyme
LLGGRVRRRTGRHDHARQAGVGRALVETCVAFAQQAGYKKIVLWTQSTLTAARALYAANGFERTRVEPHDSFGQRLDGEFWERTFARG